MSYESRKQTLKRLMDALTNGDLDVAYGCFTNDATWTVYGTTNLSGENPIKEYLPKIGKLAFPEGIKFHVKQAIVDGDFGAVQWEDYATRNGREYHNYGVMFMEFKSEMVCRIWEYIDYERFKVFYEYDGYQRRVGDSNF